MRHLLTRRLKKKNRLSGLKHVLSSPCFQRADVSCGIAFNFESEGRFKILAKFHFIFQVSSMIHLSPRHHGNGFPPAERPQQRAARASADLTQQTDPRTTQPSSGGGGGGYKAVADNQTKEDKIFPRSQKKKPNQFDVTAKLRTSSGAFAFLKMPGT